MSLRFVYACLLATSVLAQPFIKAPEKIRWDSGSFIINNRPVILFGGSMHYFRISEAEWEPALRRISSDGFNLIDTYVPWLLHEPEEGKFDFAALQRFLDLAKKYGVYIVARPGPYLCSEFDQGGFPRWLSGKGVGYRSDSEANRRWTKHWYDAVMPVLARNQVSRGGPVVMVQLENEYGHPQYLTLDSKKSYLRFLYETASAHGFDIPLMGNDIQFAQQDPDAVLSRIYGTVDAYFGSYQGLDKMLAAQRKFNQSAPVGAAEYSLDGPEATITTMLGAGTAYFDLYMFRGGSQFGIAAKSYESSSYIVGAPLEEGAFASEKYYAMRTEARFLQEFSELLATAKPAPVSPTTDDPELWLRQRNAEKTGFLFLRSDSSGVNDRTLRLEAVDRQEIRYRDPRTGAARTLPQHSTLLLRPHEARILMLDLPVRQGVTLAYSTAEVLGTYRYPNRSWLVVYGDPGSEGEVSLRFDSKPASLPYDAIWDERNNEAILRVQFSRRDRAVAVSQEVSLLVLDRDRAYRSSRPQISNQPALLVSDASEVDAQVAGERITVRFCTRQRLGGVTVLSAVDEGVQRLQPAMGALDLDLRPVEAQKVKSWTVSGGGSFDLPGLRSLPEASVWRKGITRYRASFSGRGKELRLRFFTDDYHGVWVDGKFVAEGSNRAPEVFIGSDCFAASGTSEVEVYVADTGRPKEDLGRWRMDEKKGLEAADWVQGASFEPLGVQWKASFAALGDILGSAEGDSKLAAVEYSFPRPDSRGTEAVWRAYVPDVEGLVYVNGVYLEHHEPGQTPGIYLPPSMLSETNRLVFVALEPRAELEPPRIAADPETVRMKVDVVLDLSAPRP